MDQQLLDISIVVPVYRSEKIIPILTDRLKKILSQNFSSYELILVDDRSPDDSWRVIEEMSRLHTFVNGVQLGRNAGQHNAIMAGISVTKGNIVILMDDDLQHPPEEIINLVDKIKQGADVCYTNYRNRQHETWKKIGSSFNDKVANILLKKPKNLYLSSFKAISRYVANEIGKYSGPYAYVDGLILGITDRIATVEIDHGERHSGEGNYNLRRSISLWLKMATSFSIVPLRVATFFGLFLAFVSAIVAIAIVINKLINPEIAAGWSSIIVTLLFLGGVQMAFLGIIGEYLGRAYLSINKKPQFVIRKMTK